MITDRATTLRANGDRFAAVTALRKIAPPNTRPPDSAVALEFGISDLSALALERLQLPNDHPFHVRYPLLELVLEPIFWSDDDMISADPKQWQALISQFSVSDSGIDLLHLKVCWNSDSGRNALLPLLSALRSNPVEHQTLRQLWITRTHRSERVNDDDQDDGNNAVITAALELFASRHHWRMICLEDVTLTESNLSALVNGDFDSVITKLLNDIIRLPQLAQLFFPYVEVQLSFRMANFAHNIKHSNLICLVRSGGLTDASCSLSATIVVSVFMR
jgi:hypothetical protein